MKIVFTTDAHCGNFGKNGGSVRGGVNQRCEDVLAALAFSVDHSAAIGAEYIHLGDLFDYERVEPQIIARVQGILANCVHAPTLLVGNHDQRSTAYMDHAIAPLGPVARIVDTEPEWICMMDPAHNHVVGADVLVVPFKSGRAEDWLPTMLPECPGEAPIRVLTLHLGISDTKTPYFLDGADDSVCLGTIEKLCQEHGFTHVAAGNWHKHDRWFVEGRGGVEVPVVQVGTLSPNRFTDVDGIFGTMAILDTDDGTVEIQRVPGPRFIKCATLEELTSLATEAGHPEFEWAKPLYVSATVLPEEQVEAEAELLALSKIVDLRHHEIHLNRAAEDAKTQASVDAAVSASSHEEAVVAFVKASEEDPDREHAVQTFVAQCLKEAASC